MGRCVLSRPLRYSFEFSFVDVSLEIKIMSGKSDKLLNFDRQLRSRNIIAYKNPFSKKNLSSISTVLLSEYAIEMKDFFLRISHDSVFVGR